MQTPAVREASTPSISLPPGTNIPVPQSLLPAISQLDQLETWVCKIVAFPIRLAGVALMIGGAALLVTVMGANISLGLTPMVFTTIKSGAPLVLMSGAALMNLGRSLHSPGESGLGLALYPVLMALSLHSIPTDWVGTVI